MNKTVDTVIEISKRSLEKAADDPVKSAKLVNLVYVTGAEPGITRKKSGDSFHYFLNNKKITNDETLARIKKLAIPPAWRDVWICEKQNGHLQATGVDIKNRKQYKYHSLWNKLRSERKYFRLYEFGQCFPVIRERLQKDLAIKELSMAKVLAAVVMIMEETSIRIGNAFYENLYGSFGLTTLKNRHVKMDGAKVRFVFKGKKGVQHNISLRSKRLANIVKRCHDLPGKDLFEFYDTEGKVHAINSGMVNDYIREISDAEFTSKDFRTWTGTLYALQVCKEKGDCYEEATKRSVVQILDQVAKHLGNTRAVCKKYYVHPLILDLYETDNLKKYLIESDDSGDNAVYSPEEKVLMKILEDSKATKVIQVEAA